MGKRPWGKTFTVFVGFNSLNCKSFPASHGLVDQQYKSTECYNETFTVNICFSLKMQKFPCRCVPLYGFPYMVAALRILNL